MIDKKYRLPSMSHKFKVQIVGSESNLNWAGEFTYNRPTLGERGQIDRLRASLNGDLSSIDQQTDDLHSALAHLRYTIKDAPEWWSDTRFGADLYDANVILEIFDKCLEFEKEWKSRVNGGNPEDVEQGRESSGTSVGAE